MLISSQRPDPRDWSGAACCPAGKGKVVDQVKDAATFGQLEKYFMGISELHIVPVESHVQDVNHRRRK
jgi:hypothetical protein